MRRERCNGSFDWLCVPPDYAWYKTEGKIRLRHRIPVSFFQEEMICNAQIVENCIDVNSFRIIPPLQSNKLPFTFLWFNRNETKEREGSTNTVDGFSGAALFGNSKMTRTKNG